MVEGRNYSEPFGWSAGEAQIVRAPESGQLSGTPIEILLIAHRRSTAQGESFDVSEGLVFECGRHVVLNNDRGFTLGPVKEAYEGRTRLSPSSPSMPDSDIRDVVMNVVGADEGEPEGSQPWDRLALLAQERGLAVDGDHLRALPLRIEIISLPIRPLPQG